MGGADGVSVAASGWQEALSRLGWDVVTVAGAGPVDRCIPGLAWPPRGRDPSAGQVAEAVADVDLVVVENVASLPLHPAATVAVTAALHGRPAILHHHDLPWQRDHLRGDARGWPPDQAAWQHVTINELSRRQLAARGITATTIYNGFAEEPPVDRDTARREAGLDPQELVLVHPVRAIARKRIEAAVALAEALGATYLLTGPAEEGYEPTLQGILRRARCRTVHRGAPSSAAAYAVADAVALTSAWEGFGNAIVESALYRRPLAINRYPVASELEASFGFRWFSADDTGPLVAHLAQPDHRILVHNLAVARRHFSIDRLADDLDQLLVNAGWT